MPPRPATGTEPVAVEQETAHRSHSGGLTRVARGFASLAGANIAGQAIGFVVLAIVARRVGPANLGLYTFAQAFALWFTLPALLGIGVLAVREIAREPQRTEEVAGEVLGLNLALIGLCYAAMALASLWLAPSAHARILILIIGFGWMCRAFDLTIVLQARQTLGTVAILTFVGQVVYGVLTPLLVVGGFGGIVTYTWLNQLGFVITSLGATVIVWRRFGSPRISFSPRRLTRRYLVGLPLGVPLLAGNVYIGAGAILIGYLQPARVTGLWGAASKIPFSLLALITLWTQAFYPHASVLAVREPDRLRRQVARITSIFIVFGVALSVGATLLGTDLISALFGHSYAGAGTAFALLMWWLMVEMVIISFTDVLFAAGNERPVALAVTVGAVLSIVLGLLLIPSSGASGAGVALLAAALVILVQQAASFRRRIGPLEPEWGRVLRGCAATAVMAGVIVAIPDSVSVWLRAAAGTAAFVAAALALGALTRAELTALARRRAIDEAG